MIEPTNSCNLGCPLCPTGINAKTRDKGLLKLDEFKKLIDQVKETTIEMYLQNWVNYIGCYAEIWKAHNWSGLYSKNAIDRKKRVVYITKRWKIISLLIKILPERIIRLFF